MSTIKKRTWRNRDGSTGAAYVLAYTDAAGAWVRQQYRTRAEALAERVRIDHELARGAHVTDRDSRDVASALTAWLDDYQGLVDTGRRERSTLTAYRELAAHVRAHEIAQARLSRLTPPDVARWLLWLERERTASQAKRALGLLRQVLGHAVTVGWCAYNAAAEIKPRTAGTRHDEVVMIPSREDLRALVAAAEAAGPMQAAMVSTLLFCGLRASELRGLRRQDVGATTLDVCQRADKWEQIGAPKSASSRRQVPLPPGTRRALATWMLQRPGELVFGTSKGTPTSYANIWNRVWRPLMASAGLVDAEGAPAWGLHALRHAAVSLWIAQGVDPKRVSTWAGHSSVSFTLDVYGHLWPDEDSASVAAAMERSLLG